MEISSENKKKKYEEDDSIDKMIEKIRMNYAIMLLQKINKESSE